MRVCIATNDPGGPDAQVANSFQESDFFDFYDIDDQGKSALLVQIRNCAGMCKDDVETVVRRGAEAVIAKSMSSNSLNRFTKLGVSVYRAADGLSKDSLLALNGGGLSRLGRIKG